MKTAAQSGVMPWLGSLDRSSLGDGYTGEPEHPPASLIAIPPLSRGKGASRDVRERGGAAPY